MRIKNFLYFIGFSVFAVLSAFGLMWAFGDEQGNVGFLGEHKLHFFMVRFLIIALVIGFWPKLVLYFSTRNQWPEAKVEQMTRLRWRVAVLFVLIELIIIQDILSKIF